jgi:hypothetical protein
MSGSGSFSMYILGYIVVVYCISLRRGASVNEYYYYYCTMGEVLYRTLHEDGKKSIDVGN